MSSQEVSPAGSEAEEVSEHITEEEIIEAEKAEAAAIEKAMESDNSFVVEEAEASDYSESSEEEVKKKPAPKRKRAPRKPKSKSDDEKPKVTRKRKRSSSKTSDEEPKPKRQRKAPAPKKEKKEKKEKEQAAPVVFPTVDKLEEARSKSTFNPYSGVVLALIKKISAEAAKGEPDTHFTVPNKSTSSAYDPRKCAEELKRSVHDADSKYQCSVVEPAAYGQPLRIYVKWGFTA